MSSIKARFKNKLVPYSVLAMTAVTAVLVFQNCSQVAFVPEENGVFDAASTNPKYADGKMGETTNLPDLKLFFIIDNSFTMSSSNIKLSDAFADLFSGANSNNLALFNTEVSILSTAQNISKDASKLNRSHPLLSPLIASNYDAIRTTPRLQLNQVERGAKITGKIPGDLIGFEVTKKLNSVGGEDVLLAPATVVGINDGPNGTSTFEPSIKKPVTGSVSAMNAEFKARIDLLNPSRNSVTDADLFGEPMSQESGLCALARVLKNSDKLMKPSDIVSFIVVSDEDDVFSSGAYCIEAFKKALDPNRYFNGTCEYQETKLNYKLKNTKIDYTYMGPGVPEKPRIPAQCTIRSGNQFSIAYNLKKPVTTTTTPYTTSITYYIFENYSQDNIQKTKYTLQAPKIAAANLDGKCDAANLRAFLPSNAELTVAQYKPTCSAAVAGAPVTSTTLNTVAAGQSSDALFGGKILFSDASLAAVGLTTSEIINNCDSSSACYKTKLPALLRAKDSRLAADAALVPTDIAVAYFSAGNPTLSIYNNISNADVTSTDCENYRLTCANSGMICTKYYSGSVAATPAVAATRVAGSKILDEVIPSCETSCSATDFCASTPTKTVREYIETADGRASVQCTAVTAGISSNIAVNGGTPYTGGFSCLSQCKDTTYCPSEGTKLVKDYISGQLALYKKTMDSCSDVTENKSVPFTNQLGSYKCAKGNIVVSGEQANLVDRTEYVSGTKPEGGVAKELIPFIVDKSNSYFSQNKPFFNFFVMQQADKDAGRLAEQQTVGASYEKLSQMSSGRSNSILMPSYSDALKDLSEVIKARVGKSIYFPQVEVNQNIRKVWVNKVEAVEGRDWTASGSMVTFTDSFHIERLDAVRIEFF